MSNHIFPPPTSRLFTSMQFLGRQFMVTTPSFSKSNDLPNLTKSAPKTLKSFGHFWGTFDSEWVLMNQARNSESKTHAGKQTRTSGTDLSFKTQTGICLGSPIAVTAVLNIWRGWRRVEVSLILRGNWSLPTVHRGHTPYRG